MKKVFLFLTMLLFAFVGTMRADVVEIGDGGTSSNQYLPGYNYYNYSYTQQIYTAEEIGTAGYINSVAFNNVGAAKTRNYNVYVAFTDKETFSGSSDWVPMSDDNLVFSGQLTFTVGEWTTINFDNVIEYDGLSNVIISVADVTGSFSGAPHMKCLVFDASSQAIRHYRDTSPYDVSNPGVSGTVLNEKNQIQLNISAHPNPANLAVTYNGGTTAEVSWTSDAETFNLKVNDNVIEGVTNPYTLEDLELATVYTLSVQAVYGDDDLSDWSGEVSFITDFCLEEDMCEITFEVTDSYGDGWNGNAIQVVDVATGLILAEIANTSDAAANEAQTYSLAVCDGRAIQFVWVSGNYPGETSYVVYDVNGLEIFSGAGTLSNPVNYTVSCAELGAMIIVSPTSVNMGYRPNGAWTEPAKIELNNIGKPTIVTYMSSDNSFFTIDTEAPFTMEKDEVKEVGISAGTGTPGDKNGNILMVYTENRESNVIPVTATAYDPEEGDVWEMAQEVTVPFTGNAPTGIYKNYNIPNATATAADAVYKVTFDDDVLFTATAAGGVTALYEEDFSGENGPMADNVYTYNGPKLNPSPISTWFSYAYTGTNIFFGTSAGGGMFFGYKIPASYIEYFGWEEASLMTIESAAYGDYEYNLWVLRGGETPAEGDVIYYQEMAEPATGMSFFEMEINEPFVIGNEDLWVLFYSESPYAAYCGRYPVDTENGSIVYSTNGSTWNTNANFTPVIYCYLRTILGRTVAVNLADMSINEVNGYGELAEKDAVVKGEPTAIVNNQVTEPKLTDMFVPAGTYYVAAASATSGFAVEMTTSEAPLPVKAEMVSPVDGENGVNEESMLQWTLGNYTKEFQILLGTEYPPVTPLIDWTDYLVETMFLEGIEHNKVYFVQVNERNSAGTVYGDIIGFTTEIDPVTGFAVESTTLYPGESAMFSWNANRSIKGYNLYMDGEKLNETLITTSEYEVADLEYNMVEGYEFYVTAVYDEGESVPSESINVFMTGYGTVNGTVFEQDSITPVANATVKLMGTDEYNNTSIFTFTTDEDGTYSGELYAGSYQAYAEKDGYQLCAGDMAEIVFDEETTDVNVILYEYYYPLGQINATEEEEGVEVTWAWTPAEYIVDFEDGMMPETFTSTSAYPWAITTVNPYEGTYAMKSTCEGVASATSSIEVTVDVPFDAKMGFYVKVSSESNYDKFYFYIDGTQQGAALSGNANYVYKEYAVSEGTHTYKWEYQKDGSVNSNDDCIYVDYITMYRQDVPLPGGSVYDFEDGTTQGWTTIDADGDGFNWEVGSSVMGAGYGHDGSTDLVLSMSFSNSYGALTPDNYLVSPSKIAAQNGAYISFWACGQDASWASEHFGVAVSTGSGTSANDFTTIQEWTLTAKGPQGRASDDAVDIRGTRAQGNWYQYTVDLSSYAGQEIWVAIRHFNCTDMFYIDVDDITLSDGSGKAMATGNRSFNEFRLYRMNVNVENPTPVQIGTFNDTTFSYTDTEWLTLGYGIYQWGIQAYYEGNASNDRNRQEIEIGDGGTTTNSYLPSYSYYNYSLTQQLYTAEEIGGPCTINSVSFYNGGSTKTRSYDMYMVNTSKTSFDGSSDWITATASDLVFSGSVTMVADEWTTITLDTPFTYDGTNLALIMDDNTGSWESGMACRVFDANAMAIRVYNDNTNYDPTAPAYTGTVLDVKNQIKLDVTGGGGNTTTDGLSEIIWSNTIEKNMQSTITFDVALNNGQSPIGATVAVVGENNTYNATIDEDGAAELTVRKGDTYEITVALNGYETYTTSVFVEEDEYLYDIVLEELIAPVDGLYVSPTGWAMWEGALPSGPNNPNNPSGSDSFTEDFEGGLNGWTVLTVNTDGGQWIHSSNNLGGYDYNSLAHGGTGFAMCYSYVDYVGAYNTDSYLITPQKYDITANSTLTFWADNANDSYPENFSVCVATADNPGASDFTQVWAGGAKGEGGNDVVRHSENRYQNWRSHSINLGAYAGQSVYIAFHDVNYDEYEIWIDDVALSAGSKDDRVALKYKVTLDGAFVGESEYGYFQHDVTGMEVGSEHVTGVAAVYTTGMGEYQYYTWTYAGCDDYAGVTDFAGTANNGDVTLTWTLGSSPTPPPTGGWTEDFESGSLPTGWATIDADGDGYNWTMASAGMGTGYGHNGSSDMILSQSYVNGVGALNPNNYLVTSQVTPTAGSTFSFWACAQDASYPSEHFGVAVSTGSQTNASDFTMIQEWTMTAKGSGAMAPGRDGEIKAQGNYYQYTVDLSSYAGQAIYVAIRHFNCSDWFYLDVDDVAFTTSAKGGRTVVYEPLFVTDPGAMANGADASWTKNGQGTWGPSCNNASGYRIADDFTLSAATTLTEIEVYAYQTGSTTTSTLTGMYATIYDGAPNAGGSIVWGDMTTNIMTATSFTNCYRGSDGETTATTRPIMAATATGLNIELEAGTYYLVWSLTGSLSSGPWAAPEALPGVGNSGNGLQYTSSGWTALIDASASTPYGGAFKLVGEGGNVVPPTNGSVIGTVLYRDGEYMGMVSTTSYVDAGLEAGTYEYCIRVVYDDYAMSCPQCIEVEVGEQACDPVTDLVAMEYNYQGEDGIYVDWTEPEGTTGTAIYADGEYLGEVPAGNHPIFLTFTEMPPAGTVIEIGAVALYANCESEMVTVTVTIDVEENEVVNSIYPNPTSGDLNINATAMTHVSVYNAMGQMVYDQNVTGDNMILNMGQYEAGVYMVRIDTENGSSVKRITVVK